MSDYKSWLVILVFVIVGLSMVYGIFAYKYAVDNPMCSMSINVSGDLNAERFGMEEFISNMRIEGISITAPCGSCLYNGIDAGSLLPGIYKIMAYFIGTF